MFLVVYEDLWSNKYSFQTDKLGDTIEEIIKDFDLQLDLNDIDIEKYNSEEPYDIGTFGKGFYDIHFETSDGECDGRIMIFELEY